MAHLIFYEKPTCAGNKKQRALLAAAGHTLTRENLLTTPWTPSTLRPFFGDKPVGSWFNRSAPRVKSGEVDPDALSSDQALALLVQDPVLIRRPLMQRDDGTRLVGFDLAEVERFVGLQDGQEATGSLEGCAAMGKGQTKAQ